MALRKLKRFIVRLLVSAIVLIAALGIYIWWDMRPAGSQHLSVPVTIKSGMSQMEIAKLLKEKALVRDDYLFALYLRTKPESRKIKAGDYVFDPAMTWYEMLTLMVDGKIHLETVTVTIPEGFTVKQIEDRLIKAKLMDEQQFGQAMKELSSDNEIEIPSALDSRLENRLEGYLFPQTYTFSRKAKPIDVLERMRDELALQLRQLPADWQDQLKRNGFTLHDALTIASLIEREVKVADERAHVSGIIYNRLAARMPLQIDATIQYTFGEQKERLTFKDLEIESPYNTYKNRGLPPGPIANPGFEAIKAAIYPDKTTDLYYVTRKDGSGGHYFAATFDEHRKNIRKSEQSGK